MKFNIEKLQQIATPLSQKETDEIEFQIENQDWLLMSVRIALKIRAIMVQNGIKQIDLAQRMNVSQAQITKILSGQENLSLKTIAKVETALGEKIFNIDFDDEKVSDKSRVKYSFFIPSNTIEKNISSDYSHFNILSQTIFC